MNNMNKGVVLISQDICLGSAVILAAKIKAVMVKKKKKSSPVTGLERP
jgi:hypothetical protein